MDSPAEKVAAVLRAHVASFDEAGQAYQREWSDRAAAAVLAALELTEQWGVVTEDVFGDESPDDYADDQAHAEEIAAERCQSCDSCRNALPKHVVARLVGPWIPERPPGEVRMSTQTHKHKIGTVNCGCGWHPSCVGSEDREHVPSADCWCEPAVEHVPPRHSRIAAEVQSAIVATINTVPIHDVCPQCRTRRRWSREGFWYHTETGLAACETQEIP